MMSLLKRLSKPIIFYFTVMWLIVLVVIGTIMQVKIGLYGATTVYFGTWILWIQDVLPLPGGLLTMAVIFINLLAKMAVDSPLRTQRLGTFISHAGSLVLLTGCFITFVGDVEG